MTNIKLIYFVVTALHVLTAESAISDKRKCADQNCSEKISLGRTLISYRSPDEGVLSFQPNELVTVYSKSAGSNMDLWGVEINGKRGYVPHSLIREHKVITKNLPFLVDTDVKKPVPSDNLIEPNKVEKVESIVVDGTTIYTDEARINPSSTLSPGLSTDVPQNYQTDVDKKIETYEEKPKEEDVNDQHVEVEVKPVESEDVKLEKPLEIQEEKPLEVQKDTIEKPVVEVQGATEKPVEEIKLDSVEKSVVDDVKVEDNAGEVKEVKVEEKPVENKEEKSVENKEFVENVQEENKIGEEKDSQSVEVENTEESFKETVQEEVVKENPEEILNKENEPSNMESVIIEAQEIPEKQEETVHNLPPQVFEEVPVTEIPVKEEETVSTETNLLNENSKDSTIAEEVAQEQNLNVIGNPILSQFKSVQNPMNAIFQNPLASQNLEDVEKVSQEVLSPKTENLEESNETINDLNNSLENEFSSNEKVEKENEEISFSYLNPYQTKNTPSENVSNEEENKLEVPVETPEDFSASQLVNPTENSSSNENLYYEEVTESSYLDVLEPEDTHESLEVTTAMPVQETVVEEPSEESVGFFESIMSFFGGGENTEVVEELKEDFVESNDDVLLSKTHDHFESCSMDSSQSHCSAQENPNFVPNDSKITEDEKVTDIPFFNFQDLLVVLGISGFSVVVFLWGYMVIDKMKKEAPLIAKINSLEKALLVSTKENQLLSEKMSEDVNREETDSNFNAVISELEVKLEEVTNSKMILEEQVVSLEKELENSTELGLELNKMLTDVLKSQNGNETLIDNIEQLQKQLLEQQTTINTMNTSLNEKDIENHELQLELEINNKKVVDLQSELDKMALYILEIEEDKEQCQNKFESEVAELKSKSENLLAEKEKMSQEFQALKKSFQDAQRSFEVKSTEYNLLKESIKDGNIEAVLDTNTLKAELQQIQRDNQILKESLQQNQELVSNYDKQIKLQLQELTELKGKYEEADKCKLEALTKLDVLGNYFKEKEAELQNELSKHESRWVEKQGEAISTSERIKFMQEELQNYKTQNGSLKQEIVSQEVELKSQISVLEKKAHENWVAARQAERKLDDAKQEAAQLRNRLTLRERSMIEDKSQNRLQSPLEMNGDHPLSPIHIDNPSSPPLLFNTRDLTTSPPLPGLPPFLPPPPGVPFMPPPLPGVPPFMPPPPTMFPGDHRPPPLGRRSSPPMNRYSPDSRAYSPYDRNSPSPSDDYYSPPIRGYSPYNGRDDRDMRRDYKKPMPRRNHKGGMSSGSANSTESLDNIKRHHSKV